MLPPLIIFAYDAAYAANFDYDGCLRIICFYAACRVIFFDTLTLIDAFISLLIFAFAFAFAAFAFADFLLRLFFTLRALFRFFFFALMFSPC